MIFYQTPNRPTPHITDWGVSTVWQVGAPDQRAPFWFHDGEVVCRSISAACSRVFIKVVSPEPARIACYGFAIHRAGFARTMSPRKLSREVNILHRTGRCARHFLAYETVYYAYRSERCTCVCCPERSCLFLLCPSVLFLFCQPARWFFIYFLESKYILMLPLLYNVRAVLVEGRFV